MWAGSPANLTGNDPRARGRIGQSRHPPCYWLQFKQAYDYTGIAGRTPVDYRALQPRRPNRIHDTFEHSASSRAAVASAQGLPSAACSFRAMSGRRQTPGPCSTMIAPAASVPSRQSAQGPVLNSHAPGKCPARRQRPRHRRCFTPNARIPFRHVPVPGATFPSAGP